MPLYPRFTDLPALAMFAGQSEVSADLTTGIGLRPSVIAGKSTVTVALTGGYDLIYINGASTVSASLRVAGDAQPITFSGSSVVTSEIAIARFDEYELRIVVDVTAALTTGNYRGIWLPRVKVNGTEVPILSAQYSEGQQTVGASLEFTLARPSDKALFVPDADIEFGIGQKIAGAWDAGTFDTLFSTGDTDSRNHSIGWQNNGTTDAVSVNVSSDMSAKLLKTPLTDCVIYDPLKQTLQQSNFETLYDTEGRAYLTELDQINGMTLYDVLQAVLVTRCGFAHYQTNLPDFPVARIDCGIGKPWIEAIRGVLGIFSPVIFYTEATDTLWIVDASLAMPSGFPASRTVATSNYRTLQLSDSQKKLDGFLVNYTEDRRSFDYITTRTDTETSTTGTFPNSDYTNTFIEKGFREYRKYSMPGVILREELYYQTTTVSGAFNDISETHETYTFDQLGRLTLREKTVQQRVPGLSTPAAMTEVLSESESISYAAHPYAKRSQYISRRETNVSGLIVTDSDNPQLGQDFKQGYLQGYRSGNLNSGQTTASGPISTRIETAEPRRDGQVKIKVTDIDLIHNVVSDSTDENRVGDVSIYGTQPTQLRLLVLADATALRTSESIEDLNIGELPIIDGIALARRLLARRATKMHSGTIDVIGYESGLRKGLPIALTGRNGEALGNYLIAGRRVSAGPSGANIAIEVLEI